MPITWTITASSSKGTISGMACAKRKNVGEPGSYDHRMICQNAQYWLLSDASGLCQQNGRSDGNSSQVCCPSVILNQKRLEDGILFQESRSEESIASEASSKVMLQNPDHTYTFPCILCCNTNFEVMQTERIEKISQC